MLLQNPSQEQIQIINNIETSNIIVDAVAGSGKTTTNLHIAKKYRNKSILLLTYNKDLKLDSRKKADLLNLTNLEAHSFHSFCVKYYYKKAYDDNGIIKIVKKNLVPLDSFSYDIIVVDEVQDLNQLYYKLIKKIISDNSKEANICILGDQYQCINKWNDSDWRYLKFADVLFTSKSSKWLKLNLSTTFRLTQQQSCLINKCLLFSDRMVSKTEGPRPNYIIMDSFNPEPLFNRIMDYLEIGYSYEDFFILAPSVKSGAKTDPPIRQLANKLSNSGVPIFVPNTDAEELDKRELVGKIVFSSFHQVKGRERKIVIVFNFDESYFKYYAKNKNPYKCPNELYVACTRSSEHLVLVHHYQNNYLPFLNIGDLSNYCKLIINDMLSISKRKDKTSFKTSVTDLTKHLPSQVMKNCLEFFSKEKIQDEEAFINIPRKIKGKYGIESVSEITGIAIPTYFEYIEKKNISILDKLMGKSDKVSGYDFIEDSEDEEEDGELINLSKSGIAPNTLLYIANRWNAFKTGYIFKLNQIGDYNWLSKENLNLSINRLKQQISVEGVYEVKIHIERYKELLNRELVGYIDCIDNTNVWEIKCVKVLRSEHFLQLAIYMYICMKITSKDFDYLLFNVLTNEIYRIEGSQDSLEKMMEYLIKYKYYNDKESTDKEFLENCGVK